MIKIEKDLLVIPDSIQIPISQNFPKGNIPKSSKTTHSKREILLQRKQYIDENSFNSRYKQKDVKELLKKIYNNKCAYCEQKVEQSNVEHYRPKSIYYWLAFSWDNLILACPTCNFYKDNKFDIEKTKATPIKVNELDSINEISQKYDIIESPKLINPEVTDPSSLISFNRKGEILSNNERMNYTIETCKLHRKYINDERRRIINIFQRDIKSIFVENTSIEDQKAGIRIIITKFKNDLQDNKTDFIAFRKFALKNLLADLISEAKPT